MLVYWLVFSVFGLGWCVMFVVGVLLVLLVLYLCVKVFELLTW